MIKKVMNIRRTKMRRLNVKMEIEYETNDDIGELFYEGDTTATGKEDIFNKSTSKAHELLKDVSDEAVATKSKFTITEIGMFGG